MRRKRLCFKSDLTSSSTSSPGAESPRPRREKLLNADAFAASYPWLLKAEEEDEEEEEGAEEELDGAVDVSDKTESRSWRQK